MTPGPVPASYLGSGPRDGARWAIFGAPLDATVSFRPGSRFGPAAIRAASPVLEEWSPARGEPLADHPFCDVGDLEFTPGDVDGALDAIAETVRSLGPARPLMLGGEHLVSWPAVRAVAERHPDLCVLQFDAHADLRTHYMGRSASHATVMRRIAEVVGPERCYQVGIRSGTAEEWAFGRSTRFAPHVAAFPEAWRGELAGRPLYVTVDIDFVDPAFAPGTGTPEPGGPTSSELLAAIDRLAGLQIVGADVVEVAPAYDPGGITAVLAAKVVRQLLLLA
jgi:agmatinase